MKIIVCGRFKSQPRLVDLMQPRWLATVATALVLVLSAAAAGGFLAGQRYGALSTEARERLQALKSELGEQRRQLERAQQQAESEVNALALRLGELQAQSVRLNALGQRLTEMASIDDGEFNFDKPPALGGPEGRVAMPPMKLPSLSDKVSELSRRLERQGRQLSLLEELLLDRDLNTRRRPNGRPVVSGWISSDFGNRIDPFTGNRAWHSGIDFAGPAGSEVVAVADGVVTWSGDRYGYGKMIEIDHGNGYSTRYAHNAENLVAVGERVHRDQVIARRGESGRATAPNLHFEVLQEGENVNPMKFVKGLE